ncbi:MAG: hypothetical protein M3R27_03725 [Bacteroidota bacterium]|nr:hypothetical protein [Bacteroidota bacterium]
MSDHSLEKEAEQFATYFLKGSASPAVKDLYLKALAGTPVIPAKDQKLLSFVVRNPFFTGCVDASLAFRDPHSELRRRLYIMFAILESQPEHCDFFLPVKRSPFYLFIIAWIGFVSVCKTILGTIVLKIIA